MNVGRECSQACHVRFSPKNKREIAICGGLEVSFSVRVKGHGEIGGGLGLVDALEERRE